MTWKSKPETREGMALLAEREDELFEMRAAGATWKQLCDHFKIGTTALARFISKNKYPERRARWDECNHALAEIRADEGREAIDELKQIERPTHEQIARTKLIDDRSRWEATKRGEQFQKDTPGAAGTTVVVNVVQAHLTAVQAANAAPPPRPDLEGELAAAVLAYEHGAPPQLPAPSPDIGGEVIDDGVLTTPDPMAWF